MQTVKSNEYLHYDKIIYLERYSTENETILKNGKKHAEKIDLQIDEIKGRLAELSEKRVITVNKEYHDKPLAMIRNTVKLISSNQEHISDPALYQSLITIADSVEKRIEGSNQN